jgi:hypothetical protein
MRPTWYARRSINDEDALSMRGDVAQGMGPGWCPLSLRSSLRIPWQRARQRDTNSHSWCSVSEMTKGLRLST